MDPLLGFRQLRRTRDAVDVAEGCVPDGAKVAQLPAGRREEQVLGLDVAVRPAVRVQVREPAAHLSEDGEDAIAIEQARPRAAADEVLGEGALRTELEEEQELLAGPDKAGPPHATHSREEVRVRRQVGHHRRLEQASVSVRLWQAAEPHALDGEAAGTAVWQPLRGRKHVREGALTDFGAEKDGHRCPRTFRCER